MVEWARCGEDTHFGGKCKSALIAGHGQFAGWLLCLLLGLADERFDKRFAVERNDVVDLFAGASVDDR
jgi:hypothetical protein